MGKCGDTQHNNQNQTQNPTKVQRKPIKIKYISSPLMVKASNAVEFRDIVQQLTGINSDATTPPRIHTSADVAAPPPSSSTLLAHEMEDFKFPDDMSFFLQLDEDWFGSQNLPRTFLKFQSPCFLQ